MCGARWFRCIPLHPSILPFLHTPATEHHLTSRENTVLTNREMAASCMDKGETHCACSFLLGIKRRERYGENIEERRSVFKKKKTFWSYLALTSVSIFLQWQSVLCIYNVDRLGQKQKTKKTKRQEFHEKSKKSRQLDDAFRFVLLGLTPLQERAIWLVSASKSWSDPLSQELQTPAQIHCLADIINVHLNSFVFYGILIPYTLRSV